MLRYRQTYAKYLNTCMFVNKIKSVQYVLSCAQNFPQNLKNVKEIKNKIIFGLSIEHHDDVKVVEVCCFLQFMWRWQLVFYFKVVILVTFLLWTLTKLNFQLDKYGFCAVIVGIAFIGWLAVFQSFFFVLQQLQCIVKYHILA